jgi:integrase
MTRIKGQLTTADYLPIAEFYKLINNLEADGQYMWEAYCWLSFCTACRCSDVRTLRWRDVLNRTELVRIEKKTKKSRMVKFSDDVR